MKKVLLSLFVVLIFAAGCAKDQGQTDAPDHAENLIIITLDGMRWQEVFTGMEASIASNAEFNQGDSTYIFNTYWAESAEKRRKKLMPFLWTTIADKGQIYGNRKLGNKVNNANPYWFSYPGYSELFTGFVDEDIDSNSYPNNPNLTLLTYLNRQPEFNSQIAAFTTWGAFDRILDEPDAGYPVVAGADELHGKKAPTKEKLIKNDIVKKAGTYDWYTYKSAMKYLKANQPKILYIAFGGTDHFAHAGKYRSYLDAAHQIDQWISQIWHYVQHHPAYKNKTAMLITVDHGRGSGSKWTSHGSSVEGASETWFAVIGPNIPSKGEIQEDMQLYQKQLTQTMAHILGVQFKANHPIADPVEAIWEQ